MKQPSTDNQETLYHLIQNRSLTSIELRKLTKSSYPPARIANIKDYGISIHRENEKYVNRRGKKTTIARYTLMTPIRDAKKIYNEIVKAEA